MFCPRIHALPEQAHHRLIPRLIQIRTCDNQPNTLAIPRHLEHVHLRHTPNNKRRQHRRQEQSRYSAERGFCNRNERAFDVAGLSLANGLEGADIPGDEGEDGDSDAALEEDADDGPLQDARGDHDVGVFGLGGVADVGVEDFGVEGAGYVSDDYGDGREASEALGRLSVRLYNYAN